MSIANPNQYQVSNMLNNIPASPGGLQYLQQLSKGSNPEVSPILALAELQAKNKQMAQAANAQGAAAGQQPTIAEQLKMQNAMLQRHAMAQQPVSMEAQTQEPVMAAHGGLMAFAQGGQAQDPAQLAQQQAALIAALQQQQAQQAGDAVAASQMPQTQVAASQPGQAAATQNYMSTAAATQPMYRRATAPAADVQTLSQQRQYGQGSNPEINPYTGPTAAAAGGLMSAKLPKDTFKFSEGGILHFDEGGAADDLPDSMIPKVQQPPSQPSPPLTLGTPITNREQPNIYANVFSAKDPGVASAAQSISEQQKAYLQSLSKPGQTVVKTPPAPDQRPTMPSDPRIAAVQAAQQGNMQPIGQIAAGSTPTTAVPANQGIATLVPSAGKEPSPKDEQMAILNKELTDAQARLNANPQDPRAAADIAALQKEIKRAGGNPTNLPKFTSSEPGGTPTIADAAANATTNAPNIAKGGLPSALKALQNAPGYQFATNFFNTKPQVPNLPTDPKVVAQQEKDFLESQGIQLPFKDREADLQKLQAKRDAEDAEHAKINEQQKLENLWTLLRNVKGGTFGQGLAHAGDVTQAVVNAQRADELNYNKMRDDQLQKLQDARYSNNMAQVNHVLGFKTQADQHAADAAKIMNEFALKQGEAAGHVSSAEAQAAAEDTRAAGNIIDFQIRAQANQIAREQGVSAQNAAIQERATNAVFSRISQDIDKYEALKNNAYKASDKAYYQNIIDGLRATQNQAMQGLARTAGLPSLTPPPSAKPPPTPADIAYAKAHPETRQAFINHFGVEP